jgi:translation elongation factor EF-Tu-like GTPase
MNLECVAIKKDILYNNSMEKERGIIMNNTNIKVGVETHSHTLASGHAYCTIKEMVAYAAEMGLEGIAITDHAPEMPGSCHKFYFHNIQVYLRLYLGYYCFLECRNYIGHCQKKNL